MGLAVLIILISSLYYECGFCARLMNRLQNVTTYEGENATFTCSLELTNSKLDLHEILWKADDVWIESDNKKKYEVSTNMARGENAMFIKNDTLVIKNVKLNDTGLITCIAIHQQHVQSSAWLKVNRKILPNPECSHPLKYMKQRYLGDKITTTCKAEPGDPPVQLAMYRILPSGEREVIKQAYQSSKNKLHLEFNWMITRETIANLIQCEVKFVSRLNGLKSCTTDLLGEIINRQKGRADVRVVPSTTQPTVVGETACFLCNVYDYEDSTAVWSLDGRPDVASNISRQFQYCFKNIQHSDNGRMVTCNISSKYTMVSGSARIEVVEKQTSSTNEPLTANHKESTPQLSKRVAKPEEHNEKDTGLDLTQMKILLSISLLIIIILLIVTINLVVRSRRMQGGCFHGNLLRLNTISHSQIDRQYHPVDDDGGESGDHVLLRQRNLSGFSGTEENKQTASETST